MPSARPREAPVKNTQQLGKRKVTVDGDKAEPRLSWLEKKMREPVVKQEPVLSLVPSPTISSSMCTEEDDIPYVELPAGVPNDAVPHQDGDEDEAANIYLEKVKAAINEEAVANSNVLANNARIRAKDSLDDFDVSIETAVAVRTHQGVIDEAADVMQEMDAQVIHFLHLGEKMLQAEHAFHTAAADVERLSCQLNSIVLASPSGNLRPSIQVHPKSLSNAIRARDMFYKAAARIRKLSAEQHKRHFDAQMALLPAGSDSLCRAARKRRSREKKGKKE